MFDSDLFLFHLSPEVLTVIKEITAALSSKLKMIYHLNIFFPIRFDAVLCRRIPLTISKFLLSLSLTNGGKKQKKNAHEVS